MERHTVVLPPPGKQKANCTREIEKLRCDAEMIDLLLEQITFRHKPRLYTGAEKETKSYEK